MNVQTLGSPANAVVSRVAIADRDIHPAQRTPRDLDPDLPLRWRNHIAEFSAGRRLGMQLFLNNACAVYGVGA